MDDFEWTIWQAAIATAMDAPLPDNIEDAPDYFREWYRLMRPHDPKLSIVTDVEIQAALTLEL
jgi:hypothetical protein